MPDITIRSLDGAQFGGYAAFPKNDSAPGLVVIQEIFGVNAAMRSICDDFAAQGYVAVCPDLFWRQEPNVQLTDQAPADWERAFTLYKNFDVEAGVRDLLAALAHARLMKGSNGKVGAVGYCLGGRLAWLMAARSDIDCTVSYYGVNIENMLDEIYEIRAPLLLHIAENDKFVSPAARQKILDALPRNPVVAAFTYPGAEHAFARPGGQNFREGAANLARERTAAFLKQHLMKQC